MLIRLHHDPVAVQNGHLARERGERGAGQRLCEAAPAALEEQDRNQSRLDHERRDRAGDEVGIAAEQGLRPEPDLASRGETIRRNLKSFELPVVEHETADAVADRTDRFRRLSREEPPDRAPSLLAELREGEHAPADEAVADHRAVDAEDGPIGERREQAQSFPRDEAAPRPVAADAPVEHDRVLRQTGDPLLEIRHRKSREVDEVEPVGAGLKVLPKLVRLVDLDVGGAVDEGHVPGPRQERRREIDRLRHLETRQDRDHAVGRRQVPDDTLVLDENDRHARPQVVGQRADEVEGPSRHGQDRVDPLVPVLLAKPGGSSLDMARLREARQVEVLDVDVRTNAGGGGFEDRVDARRQFADPGKVGILRVREQDGFRRARLGPRCGCRRRADGERRDRQDDEPPEPQAARSRRWPRWRWAHAGESIAAAALRSRRRSPRRAAPRRRASAGREPPGPPGPRHRRLRGRS